ncbi:MAG: hypothetical protein WDM85_02275 [Caulobacteraceae bacterium]
MVGLLAVTAIGVAAKQGSATDFGHASYRPPLDANGAILWATMVFGVAGSEALAFMRNDVRGGMRTILGVLALVAVVQIVFYLVGTGSLLAILTPQAATRLSGLPDALILGLKTLGLGPVAPLVLFAAFLCSLGSYSACSASARGCRSRRGSTPICRRRSASATHARGRRWCRSPCRRRSSR